jgi:DNA (cytosine-5)-methyltransferase 1
LVFKFLKWANLCEPDVFVIENVPGIETKYDFDGIKIMDKIRDKAKKYGYNIQLWKLNAVDFGVPQYRKRTFIVGTRGVDSILNPPVNNHYSSEDINELFNKDKKIHVTVGDAILDLPVIRAKEGSEILEYSNSKKNISDYQSWARKNSKFVFNHAAMHHTQRLVDRYQLFIEGIRELPEELRVRERSGGGKLSTSKFNSNYRYLDPKKPSFTVPASFYSSFVHPTTPRNITAREAARIQSFPDYYCFKGKRTLVSKKLLIRNGKADEIGLSQYNQIGNAVPPLLSKAIGESILAQI